jgi:hypothetical protein
MIRWTVNPAIGPPDSAERFLSCRPRMLELLYQVMRYGIQLELSWDKRAQIEW